MSKERTKPTPVELNQQQRDQLQAPLKNLIAIYPLIKKIYLVSDAQRNGFSGRIQMKNGVVHYIHQHFAMPGETREAIQAIQHLRTIATVIRHYFGFTTVVELEVNHGMLTALNNYPTSSLADVV